MPNGAPHGAGLGEGEDGEGKGGKGEDDEPEWLRAAGELMGWQLGQGALERSGGAVPLLSGGRGGKGGRGGRGGRGGSGPDISPLTGGRGGRGGRGDVSGRGGRGGMGGVVTAASRDADRVVRRLAFSPSGGDDGDEGDGDGSGGDGQPGAVVLEFEELLDSAIQPAAAFGVASGCARRPAGSAEAETQTEGVGVEAGAQTTGVGTAEAGAQATAAMADEATQTAELSPPSPPSLLIARASQTDAGGDDLAVYGGSRRSGGRQRERWRALRQQQAGAAEPQAYDVLGVRARAREELELLTGVSAAEVERRLQAAHERCLARGWDWGGLDDGALA